MYLMLKDRKVLYYDFNDMVVEIINNDLVPYGIRGRILNINSSKPSDIAKVLANNIYILKDWLSNRVLSTSRDNAKQIFGIFGLSQSNSKESRIDICNKCKGISVTDSYWICSDNEHRTWDSVNIRKSRFKEIVDIALCGENPSFTTSPLCPELTTKGLFRKAWIRDYDSNELYLLKSDKHINNINTRCEVLASHIIDCIDNIKNVKYTGRLRNTKLGKMYVDKCKNFVDDSFSFVEAREMKLYLDNLNMDFKTWAMNKFGYKIANIVVADYIVMNTDRHDENYGFMMDNNTGEIVDVAPLFDFNLSLVSDIFDKDAGNTISQMFNDGETIINLTNSMLPYSKILLNNNKFKEIKKYFRDYKHVYNSVVQRLNNVGLL